MLLSKTLVYYTAVWATHYNICDCSPIHCASGLYDMSIPSSCGCIHLTGLCPTRIAKQRCCRENAQGSRQSCKKINRAASFLYLRKRVPPQKICMRCQTLHAVNAVWDKAVFSLSYISAVLQEAGTTSQALIKRQPAQHSAKETCQ